jgi:nucleoid DNA-binding protein
MEHFKIPFTRQETHLLIDLFIEGITEGLVEDGKVGLREFGKLELVSRKGRTYKVRGTEVTVPDRKTVVFKPGSKLFKRIKTK